MIDFEALLLDPVYAATGSPAVLTDKSGQTLSVTVLDHRDGLDQTNARGGGMQSFTGISAEEAVLYVRHSECPVQPIGWRVKIDGEDQSYAIRSGALKGRPGKGEWVLTLQKA